MDPRNSTASSSTVARDLDVKFRSGNGDGAGNGKFFGPAMKDGRFDPFLDSNGTPRVLRGVCVYSNATRLAELAALIGFEAVWIEMEHGPADFTLVESLCVSIEAGGAVPTVRVPDGQRHHVLRALEVGARIVVVPMVNTAEEARSIVNFGKFPTLGSRGFNTRSRGIGFGLSNGPQTFEDANARTHLFAQIETLEAVQNIEAICAVEGLSGIFIGPGDLSFSAGCPGEINGAKIMDLVAHCVRTARRFGKHAGILVTPGPTLNAAMDSGADLVFAGGDITELLWAWPRLLASLPATAAER